MQDTPDTRMKSKLLDLLDRARADQQALIDSLTDAEREAIGEPDRWAVKDHLVHLSAWKQQTALRIGAVVRGEPVATIDDFEEFNARTFAEQRLRPWHEVQADAERILAEVAATVESCTEEQLTDLRFGWRQGQAIWLAVVGNAYEHPAEHYSQLYLERGDLPHAAAQQQITVETLAQLFGKAEAYGNALYNLGCFYAKTGQAQEAIAAVGEALAINPELGEWSGQDADLDSLRGMPAFEALYTR
jgi:tetratricopeptide (TPR) repeat protein